MDTIISSMQLLDYAGKLISCIVTVFFVFQFFNTRYERLLSKRLPYIGWAVFCCALNLLIYLFNNPLLNITFWISIILITSKIFYHDSNLSRQRYYMTNVAFVFVYAICEALGCFFIEASVPFMQAGPGENAHIVEFVRTICGSAMVILMYYLFLKRLFNPKRTVRISWGQWAIYAIITAYALINICEILFLIRHGLTDRDYLFLMVDGIFIIVVNLYLFYLLDAFAENKDLKYKLMLYERQAQSNYEYYIKQMENHKKTLAVIHDVRKHMRIADAYEQQGQSEQRKEYVDNFEEMIAPLLMFPYCENAILNIIINDKAEYCKEKNISFDVDIREVDLGFMQPIDITTIFGNLLDNAVEACEASEEKKIQLKIHPFNGLIYMKISNTYINDIQWDEKGRPVSNKGRDHGIGLENVEQTLREYHGSLQMSAKDQVFTTEVMFNRP
ncbi:MAG: ATP-binding protein [Lachnospiraceae bacterium]|nr:ATP-binding protein [Lachnospiraceae bacterium]